MEIQWTDVDPATGERRWIRAERFAKVWRFRYRGSRRGIWEEGPPPTREMWEHVLDALQRRYRFRDGVSDDDIADVKAILARMPKQIEEE